ncbi:hypothetical protein ACHAWF_006562 [Thalassiosira exigua]
MATPEEASLPPPAAGGGGDNVSSTQAQGRGPSVQQKPEAETEGRGQGRDSFQITATPAAPGGASGRVFSVSTFGMERDPPQRLVRMRSSPSVVPGGGSGEGQAGGEESGEESPASTSALAVLTRRATAASDADVPPTAIGASTPVPTLRRRSTIAIGALPPQSLERRSSYRSPGIGAGTNHDDDDARSVVSGAYSIQFGPGESEDDECSSGAHSSGSASGDGGPDGMEVMDLRPSAGMCDDRTVGSVDTDLASFVANFGLRQNWREGVGAAATQRQLRGLGVSASAVSALTADNPLTESEDAYRTLMRLMSSGERVPIEEDDGNSDGSGASDGGGRVRRRESFSSVASLGAWSAMAPLPNRDDMSDHSGSTLSSKTEKRRQWRRRYVKRCARAMAVFLVLVILSCTAVYLVEEDLFVDGLPFWDVVRRYFAIRGRGDRDEQELLLPAYPSGPRDDGRSVAAEDDSEAEDDEEGEERALAMMMALRGSYHNHVTRGEGVVYPQELHRRKVAKAHAERVRLRTAWERRDMKARRRAKAQEVDEDWGYFFERNSNVADEGFVRREDVWYDREVGDYAPRDYTEHPVVEGDVWTMAQQRQGQDRDGHELDFGLQDHFAPIGYQ